MECEVANPERFKNEGFCFLLVAGRKGDDPGTGDP